MGKEWGKVFRNMYRRHMDGAKEGWDSAWETGMAGVGVVGGGRKLYLNNNKK